jgi:hypothetical protein
VQVHKDDAVDARFDNQVCHQLGGDGDSRHVFAILPRVAIVWDDGGDAAGGGSPAGIDHDKQFHKMLCWRVRGLDNENIHAANVLIDLEKYFPVCKSL